MPERTEKNLKVAVVTGANSGVGLALTVSLAKTYRVFAGVRTPSEEKCKALITAAVAAGVAQNVEVIELDVDSDSRVKKCVASILSKTNNQIDLLVNNAGYSVFGSVEQIDMEDVIAQFNTNVFGVIRMQQAVLPAMRSQKSGLLINISSVGGIYGQPFNDVYCASKFALEGLTESQCALFKTFGVDIVNVEPGAISSSFTTNAKTPAPEKTPAEYVPGLQSTMAAYHKSMGAGQTPEEVAEFIMSNVVGVKNPPLRVQTSPIIEKAAARQLGDTTGMAGVKVSADRFLSGLTEL